MLQLLIDYGSIVAFATFTVGVLLQMKKILKRRSSRDIASSEVLLRFVASVIIFAKIITIKDPYLIIGQGLLLIFLSIYIAIAIRYRSGPLPSPPV